MTKTTLNKMTITEDEMVNNVDTLTNTNQIKSNQIKIYICNI